MVEKRTKGQNQGESGNLLVVNMRGIVNTRRPVLQALHELHITKRFNATVVPNNQMFMGVLNCAKEHVAWCEVDDETIEKLVQKNQGAEKESTDKDTSMDNSQKRTRHLFRLNPPKGGFKRSTRRQFNQGGVLGRNNDLLSIVEKMTQ